MANLILNEDVNERLWTVSDVAKYLRLSQSGVRKLKTRGVLPFIKLGGSVRFSKAAIDEFLSNNRRTNVISN